MGFVLKKLTSFYSAQSSVVHKLLILVLVLFSYRSILTNQFVWDDQKFILDWSESHQPLKNLPYFFSGKIPIAEGLVYRPIRSLMYSLSFILFGGNPAGYHLQSVMIHLLSSWLIYEITKILLKDDKVALVSGLLFGLHPMAVESVVFATASFDTMGLSLMFLSFYLYIQNKKNLSVGVILVAHFITEFTLIFPIIIYLYDAIIGRKKLSSIGKIFKRYRLFMYAIIVYWLARLLLKPPTPSMLGLMSPALSWMYSISFISKYLSLFVYPNISTVNHLLSDGLSSFFRSDMLLSAQSILNLSKLSLGAYLSSGLVVLLTILLVKIRKTNKYISFFGLSMMVSFLPVLQVFPTTSLFSERYAYVPLFFFCMLVGSITGKYYGKGRNGWLKVILLIIVFGLFVIKTNTNVRVWKNDKSLWTNALAYSPKSSKVLVNLGMNELRHERYQQALYFLERAVENNADYNFARYNLALLYLSLGESDLAIEHFGEGIIRSEDPIKARDHVENLLIQSGNEELVGNL